MNLRLPALIVWTLAVSLLSLALQTLRADPLSVEVTLSPNPVRPGEWMHCRITVVNSGGEELRSVWMTNTVPGSINRFDPYDDAQVGNSFGDVDSGDSLWWYLGTIPAGQSQTRTFAMQVASTAAAGTVLTDLVSVSGTNAAGARVSAGSSANALVESAPALRLTMEADQGPVSAGQTITYNLRYMNAGTAGLTDTALRVQLPEGVSFVAASGGGAANDGEVSWALGTVGAKASGERVLRARVASGVGSGKLLVAVAEVADGLGTAAAKVKLASVVTAGGPLVATVNMSPDGAKPGDWVHAAVTVANRGDEELQGVWLQNVVPGSINRFDPYDDAQVGNSFGDVYSGDSLWWYLGTIPAGQSQTRTFAMQVASTAAAGTVLTDLVSVSGTNAAGARVSAASSANALVESAPALRLTMRADVNQVRAGERVRYTLECRNAAAFLLSGIQLRVIIPSDSVVVSSDGGSVGGTQILWELGSVAAGASLQRTFDLALPLDSGKAALVIASASLTSSSPNWASRASALVVVKQDLIFRNPETFEDLYGDWTIENGVWEITRASATANGYAGTVIDGDYPNNTDARLVSPEFVVPAAAEEPRLRFRSWHLMADANDYGQVQVRVNGGGWVNLTERITGDTIGAWEQRIEDLKAYAGQRVQIGFHFVSDGTGTQRGWAVDDVGLETGPLTIDLVNRPETFQNGWGNWSVKGSVWQMSQPSMSTNGYAGTILGGNYPNNADARLISPEFVVPPANQQPQLRFRSWHRFYDASDYGVAQVRLPEGTWEDLKLRLSGSSNSDWQERLEDLAGYGGKKVQIAFRFVSGPSGVSSGWYVDDVEVVAAATPPDLVTKDLLIAPNSGPTGGTMRLTANILNDGGSLARASVVHVRLGASSTSVSTSDVLLASIPVPEIAPRSVQSVAAEVAVPSGTIAGQYYVWVILDVDSSAGQGLGNEANDQSAIPFLVTGPSTPPTISGIIPNPVIGSDRQQIITIRGSGFAEKPAITLSWTGQPGYALPSSQVTFVSSTEMRMAITTSRSPDAWTVRASNPDGQTSADYSFSVVAPDEDAAHPRPFGLTIITHGFQPPAPIGNGALAEWVMEMAKAITNRVGAAIPIYAFRFDKASLLTKADDKIVFQGNGPGIDLTQCGGAIILLDWTGVSNETLDYPAQDVADLFFTYLFKQAHNGLRLAEVPIHLVGHSRGCSLIARLAHNLALMGVVVDQFTTLDPHPVRWGDWEPGSDLVPAIYGNVIFADNYFQEAGLFEGMGIAGAFNESLSTVLEGSSSKRHVLVHTYYHGTIDLSPLPLEVDGEPVLAAWYEGSRTRNRTGYSFSRQAASGLKRPETGQSQTVAGLGGRGSRIIIDPVAEAWPNICFDHSEWLPRFVPPGQAIKITYLFADQDSDQTIVLSLDDDMNPYNGVEFELGEAVQNRRPAGSIGRANFTWTPLLSHAGTHFIQIRTTDSTSDGARIRYDYRLDPLTVRTDQAMPLRISEVAQAAFESGFRGGSLVNAVAVAGAESAFELGAHCLNCLGVPEDSRGLWQINHLVHTAYDGDLLLTSAAYNATAAHEIAFAGGSANWRPWSAFNEGKFVFWLTASRDAAKELDATVIQTAGDEVIATEDVEVRPAAGAGSVTRRVSAGTSGTVVDGPLVAAISGGDGYRLVWWKIHWGDGGNEGWSAEDYLSRITYPLVLSVEPPEGGSIVPNAFPSSGDRYAPGKELVLSAVPNAGYVLQNWSGVRRAEGSTAWVTMSGPVTVNAAFRLLQQSTCGCPARHLKFCSEVPRQRGAEDIDLALITRFRDKVLAATPQGQAFTRDFYKHGPEIVHHFLVNTQIQAVALEAVVGLQPILADLLDGSGGLTISSNQAHAVSTLVVKLKEVAGSELAAVLEKRILEVGTLQDLTGKTSAEVQRSVLGMPLSITQAKVDTNGVFEFTVGGDLNGTFRAQYSHDLTEWIDLVVPPSPQLPTIIRDERVPSDNHRYYRVLMVPY